ncbi:hypothetical protein RKD49_002102 [Streptomyces glaucescens]
MAKMWKPGQERKFCRELELGKPYYIVYKTAQNMAPWEDPQMYAAYVFTKRLPFTSTPCTKYGSDAATLLRLHGPVYATRPPGMRNIADAPPQVAGPLPKGYVGHLDEAEIRGLEKRVSQSSDPKKRRWGR